MGFCILLSIRHIQSKLFSCLFQRHGIDAPACTKNTHYTFFKFLYIQGRRRDVFWENLLGRMFLIVSSDTYIIAFF